MLICIFGKRGSGKTTTIKGQLENCRGPVVVIDVLGNFNDEQYVQVEKIDDCVRVVRHYVQSSDKSELQKIIVLKPADPDVAVDYMSAVLWECGGGTLVLDEVDCFSVSAAPCYDQLIRYGRNRNIDLITGCRRPAELSRNITAGANKLFVFQTQEPRDVDYYESTVLGADAEKLMAIPQYTGLFVDYDLASKGSYRIDKEGRIFIINSEPLFKAQPKTLTKEET